MEIDWAIEIRKSRYCIGIFYKKEPKLVMV